MITQVEKRYTKNEEINVITVKNNLGFEVSFTDFGAAIYTISYPDKKGNVNYVTHCPKDLDEFVHSGCMFGKAVGRVAGRLKDAKAIVNGVSYDLEKNNGKNCLHSGSASFGMQRYNFEIKLNKKKIDIIFSLTSLDGEGGFPGTVKAKIIYTIYENKKELNVRFKATCDQPTLLNLTSHVYINLNGGFKPIYDQELYLRASKVSDLDDGLIIKDFINVPPYLDYTRLTPLKNNILNKTLLEASTKGMDHVFLLDGINSKVPSAILFDKESKRKLTVYTSYPAIVVYGYNFPTRTESMSNVIDDENYAITFETVIPTDNYEAITFSKERPYDFFAKYKFN